MNIGIVVEGQDDYTTYPTLIQRIRNDIERSQVRECGGKSRLKNGFLNFLREFQNPAWQIEIAVVIRDSDCQPPQPIENQLRTIFKYCSAQAAISCGILRHPMYAGELAC
jgi:hypothetical protein